MLKARFFVLGCGSLCRIYASPTREAPPALCGMQLARSCTSFPWTNHGVKLFYSTREFLSLKCLPYFLPSLEARTIHWPGAKLFRMGLRVQGQEERETPELTAGTSGKRVHAHRTQQHTAKGLTSFSNPHTSWFKQMHRAPLVQCYCRSLCTHEYYPS